MKIKYMSYIIRNNEFIAETNKHYKSGTSVLYSFKRCFENIDTSRDFNLVNAQLGKISNAKKWSDYKEWCGAQEVRHDNNLSQPEFFI